MTPAAPLKARKAGSHQVMWLLLKCLACTACKAHSCQVKRLPVKRIACAAGNIRQGGSWFRMGHMGSNRGLCKSTRHQTGRLAFMAKGYFQALPEPQQGVRLISEGGSVCWRLSVSCCGTPAAMRKGAAVMTCSCQILQLASDGRLLVQVSSSSAACRCDLPCHNSGLHGCLIIAVYSMPHDGMFVTNVCLA